MKYAIILLSSNIFTMESNFSFCLFDLVFGCFYYALGDFLLDLVTINLEQGMPTVAVARQRLEQALRTARARKTHTLKIIHGYGSSGRGGAIKRDVQQFLSAKLNSKEIRAFAAGENFSPFDASARKIIDACPELRHDRDYSRGNDGITIVLI